MSNTCMTPMKLDTLREISNIGMGNALTSLSQLINQKINMSVPRAGFHPLETVITYIGGVEKPVTCVSLRVLGGISGTIMFVFDQPSISSLVDLLGLSLGNSTELDEMAESAIKEVGNVLAGSFINAICSMTQLNIINTVPVIAFDMLGAIITSIMIASGRVEDNILLIETELFQLNKKVTGHFILLADPESIDTLFENLGIS